MLLVTLAVVALCAADVSELKDSNGYAYPTPDIPFPPVTYLPPTFPPVTYLPPVEEVIFNFKNLYVIRQIILKHIFI